MMYTFVYTSVYPCIYMHGPSAQSTGRQSQCETEAVFFDQLLRSQEQNRAEQSSIDNNDKNDNDNDRDGGGSDGNGGDDDNDKHDENNGTNDNDNNGTSGT